MPLFGCLSPRSSTNAPNCSLSSAASIDAGDVPIIGAPASNNLFASFNGVCPPNWTMTPDGFLS